MKKKSKVERPVTPQDEMAFKLFSEYSDGSSADIMLINKTKNLLFLSDYIYTLESLKADNSPYERLKRIYTEEFIKSL